MGIRFAAAVIVVALCVDVLGLDCQRRLATGHGSVGAGWVSDSETGPDATGPDCLCCSTLDLAVTPAAIGRPADGRALSAVIVARPADGSASRLYRPPLS
jgi:hypothetical protein